MRPWGIRWDLLGAWETTTNNGGVDLSGIMIETLSSDHHRTWTDQNFDVLKWIEAVLDFWYVAIQFTL